MYITDYQILDKIQKYAYIFIQQPTRMKIRAYSERKINISKKKALSYVHISN